MSTIEERVQALEHENTTRRQTEELLTITVRALVSKEAFEHLQETINQSQEQNGKLFDTLNAHNVLTNERLGDIQGQLIDVDGKVTGLQTEMRQHFTEQDGKVVGLQTEMRQQFGEVHTDITSLKSDMSDLKSLAQQILARLPKEP